MKRSFGNKNTENSRVSCAFPRIFQHFLFRLRFQPSLAKLFFERKFGKSESGGTRYIFYDYRRIGNKGNYPAAFGGGIISSVISITALIA
jgi:hypothetical protein